uniref:Uncharacterized protein n=1 Tax=Cucumis melo TaxID=3656 RepID=A0A9I9EJN9_CUCME
MIQFLSTCKLSKPYIIWQSKFLNALKDNDGHFSFIASPKSLLHNTSVKNMVWHSNFHLYRLYVLVLLESIGETKPYLRQFIDI